MKWKLKKYDTDYLSRKHSEFDEIPLITKLLLNRGITKKEEVDKFLNITDDCLLNPFLLETMDIAVERIRKAKENDENILIYGDYDVDGITSTAYLVIALMKLGLKVDYYIPNREHQGVGINQKLLKYLLKKDIKLFITVDTSIGNVEEILLLKNKNIDIIITDHHRINEEIKALDIPIINPKISDKYENKNLAGVGVAFKFATAIYEKLNGDLQILNDYIDIVMIGTVADVVPMIDENRYIIKKGLLNLKNTKVKGLSSLINLLNINPENMTASDIGFYIAPMFNALGRVDSSKIVVEFLIQEDNKRIEEIVEKMKVANKLRKYIETEMYDEIEERIKNLQNPKYIFMKSRRWHSGVIGAVCSRISMKYNIPVILVSVQNGYAKASCRSVEGFNIFDLLNELSSEFDRFGGHDLAAGFIISEKKLNIVEKYLKSRLTKIVKSKVEKEILVDSYFGIEGLNKNRLANINKLSPFGLNNQEPNFLDKGVEIIKYVKFGVNNRHFKGFVKKNDRIIAVLGYNLGNKLKYKGNNNKLYDIIYTPTFRLERDDKFIELKIKDFKESNLIKVVDKN